MIQALKLNHTVEEGLVPHGNIFREMKRQKRYLLCKVTLSVPASPSPLPSLRQQDQPLLFLLLSLFNKMTRMKTFMMAHVIVNSHHVVQFINLRRVGLYLCAKI